MSLVIQKVGAHYVAAEDGTWLPGVFDTRDTAEAAASLEPGLLDEIWLAAQANGIAILTMEHINP